MALRTVLDTSLTALANEIRRKGGTAAQLYWPGGFITAINAIDGGGGTDWKTEFVNALGGEDCLIPDDLAALRDYCFYKKTGITNALIAALPASITTIGAHCFDGCTGISQLDLSDRSIETIGGYAFNGLVSVAKLDLSDNDLTSLGEYLCGGMSNLNEIDLSGNGNLLSIPAYMAQDVPLATLGVTGCPIAVIGAYAFYDCALTAFPLAGLTTLLSIGDYAFAKSVGTKNQIVTLDLSGCTNLQTIGTAAFQLNNYNAGNADRGKIASVIFPKSLTSIGQGAFYKNIITGTVDLSDNTGLVSIGDSCFRYNSAMSGLDLSGCTSLQTIGVYVCANTMLASLDLSDCSSLRSIGEYAFDNCPITGLNLSDCVDLQTIGQYAFRGSAMTSLIWPAQTLTSIGQYAFYGQKYITGPMTVKAATIGQDAFNGCTGITELTIEDCNKYNVSNFANCTGLTKIYIKKTPTGSWPSNINTYPVFNGCTNVTDIYVPWSQGAIPETRFFKAAQNPTWHYDTVF